MALNKVNCPTSSYRHADNGTLVIFEHFETFAGLELPAPDRVVGGAGEQDLACTVDGQTRDDARVLLERLQCLGRLERPRYRLAVRRTRHQYVLVRRAFFCVVVVGRRYKKQRVDAACVGAVFAHAFAAVEVPTARRAVVRAAQHEVSDADDSIDHALVAFQYRHARARRHVPLANCLQHSPRQRQIG